VESTCEERIERIVIKLYSVVALSSLRGEGGGLVEESFCHNLSALERMTGPVIIKLNIAG